MLRQEEWLGGADGASVAGAGVLTAKAKKGVCVGNIPGVELQNGMTCRAHGREKDIKDACWLSGLGNQADSSLPLRDRPIRPRRKHVIRCTQPTMLSLPKVQMFSGTSTEE